MFGKKKTSKKAESNSNHVEDYAGLKTVMTYKPDKDGKNIIEIECYDEHDEICYVVGFTKVQLVQTVVWLAKHYVYERKAK